MLLCIWSLLFSVVFVRLIFTVEIGHSRGCRNFHCINVNSHVFTHILLKGMAVVTVQGDGNSDVMTILVHGFWRICRWVTLL